MRINRQCKKAFNELQGAPGSSAAKHCQEALGRCVKGKGQETWGSRDRATGKGLFPDDNIQPHTAAGVWSLKAKGSQVLLVRCFV